MAAQIAAYQQQLRSAGAPGSGVPAPGSGVPAPRSQASGRVPDQSFDRDMAEIEEVEVEEDPGAQIAAYQLQLRSRDEADAVAGIACGNLTDVVASRAAPKSNTYSQPGSLGAQSARSLHSQMPPTQQSALGGGGDHFLLDGPTECTCDVGMTQLCPYCTMVCHDPLPPPRTPHTSPEPPGSLPAGCDDARLAAQMNGPQSTSSMASSYMQPDSSVGPSMPNSYSSYAGMPSQMRHG